MPLHPLIAAQLQLAVGTTPYFKLPLREAREAARKPYLDASRPVVEVAHVREVDVPGPLGDIRVRVYTPFDVGLRPLLVFFHGSGFTILDLDTHDEICRRLCVLSGCVVASVDYRLAPENPFPAGPNDCIAATKWLVEHARDFRCRSDALGLAGDSAGACLAAVTALALRDDPVAPPAPRTALLMWYPVTDHPSARWPSFAEFAQGYGLSAEGLTWFWSNYLSNVSQASDPMASPYRATSLAGLPQTWVTTAEYDVLRDEGEAFGERLRREGVLVETHRAPGMNHGFLKYCDQIDAATQSMQRAGAWLREALG